MGKFSHQIQWDITRSVVLTNIFYFLYDGGKACLFPFITLYFRSIGLSATQTGLICGSKSFIWYFAAPVWLILAKRAGKTKIVLGTALLFAIATNLSITLVPPANDYLFLERCKQQTSPIPHESLHTNITTSAGAPYLTSSTSSPHSSTNLLVEATLSSSHNLKPTSSKLSKKLSPKVSPVPKVPKTTTTSTVPKTSTKSSKSKETSSEPNIALSSTTTTQLSRTSTSSYQLARFLMPRIIKDHPSSPSDMEELLSQYRETRNWPKWRKRVLLHQIMDIINNSSDELEREFGVKVPKDEADYSDVKKKNTANNPTDFSADKKLDKISEKLMTLYWNAKLNDSSLTIPDFIQTIPELKGLPSKTKKMLIQALEKEINSNYKKKRSIRSTSDVSNLTLYNSSVNAFNESASSMDMSGKTLKIFVEEVYSKITDNTMTFLIVLAVVVAGEFISAPIDLLSDNSFYELLDELDSVDKYGRHKVYALVGAVLGGISVSTAVYFSPCVIVGDIGRFNIHFYAFAGLAGLAFLVVPFYPTYSDQKSNRSTSVTVCPTCAGRMCCEFRRFLMMLTVFIVGVTQAGMHDFMLWGIQDMPGSSHIVYGSYVSVGALCSLLAIPFGRRIMATFKPNLMVPFSLVCIATQLLLYSFISNPWLVVPIQVLNICGVPFLWIVIGCQTNLLMSWQDDSGMLRRIDEVHVFAKASKKRALHHAYYATYQGLSFGFGSVLSGVVYDLAGKSLCGFLRVGSVIIFAWAFLYLLYQCCCVPRRKHKKYSKLLEDSEDEEDIFNVKDKNSLGFPKDKPGRYVQNGKRKEVSKKKRRSKRAEEVFSSSSEDELQHDWLAMAMRKDSHLL